MQQRQRFVRWGGRLSTLAGLWAAGAVSAAELPRVDRVELQPLLAATARLVEALDVVGSPLPEPTKAALLAAGNGGDAGRATAAIQTILDPLCVAGVTINAESRVSVVEGPAAKDLVEQGWRTFLVKVHNLAGITPPLRVEGPQLKPMVKRSSGSPDPRIELSPEDASDRWLDATFFTAQPLEAELSGLALEYRILQLHARDAGKREASLGFNVGQGTQDLGFRATVPILFECLPAVAVTLGVHDHDGAATTASFVFRDRLGRVHPNPARRLAPDFFFHDQVYRSDGETISLPPGEYSVELSRGPEYRVARTTITVPAGAATHHEDFRLVRWIQPSQRRWYSGDHHVHAAGCAHYENPTAGVGPADMMRHIVGENLDVGCILSWGPCWYVQKQHFEGRTSALSTPQSLMRYDVEVSGFPSSHAGHLCLLRLTEDDYPGTTLIEEWPSWTQPVLAWGREQGGVVGYSHSGWGLELPDVLPGGGREFRGQRPAGDWPGKAAAKLPDFAMPRFDGIGANEYVVTAATGVCDFLSAVDTPAVWELNVWYHTLNCGLTPRISGETDFPCIYGDKVGLGRIYVKLDEGQPLDFDAWVKGVKDGRSYCGDGLSHVLEFTVDHVAVGEPGDGGKLSTRVLDRPGTVTVACDVAALLADAEPTPATEAIRSRRLDDKPYWHLERARVGASRQVPVEVIVNGEPVLTRMIEADGHVEELGLRVPIERSSWVAIRIFPSVHTNPVWVEVADKPVRASRRSAQWCREAVDVCWKAKLGQIREAERAAAAAAYDEARAFYDAAIAAAEAE